MDYMYNFKQAHRDRLEDAGVIQYRPVDGFGLDRGQRQSGGLVRRIQVVLAAIAQAIVSIVK